MKKILAVLILTSIFISSCGTTTNLEEKNIGNLSDVKDESSDTNNVETTEADYLSALGKHDFTDDTFIVLDANDHPELHVNMPADVLNGEVVNDALYIRDDFIESSYSVDIQYQQLTNAATGAGAFKKSVLAGDNSYDMIISTLYNTSIATLATNGILYDLLSLPSLSLDSVWWSPLIYENLKFNGKLFYSTGDISPVIYDAPMVFFVNKKLAADYGINDSYYKMVYDGTWTLDVVKELTKDLSKDLNNDNTYHASDDFFGLIAQTNVLTTNAYIAGAGVKFNEISTDGSSITVNMNNEHTIKVLDKIKEIYVIPKYKDQNDIISLTFKEDRALFLCHCLESARYRLRDMASDYSILPMPKNDEAQESYYSFINAWVDSFVAAPVNCDNTEKTGFLMEAMAYYSYKNLRPAVYETTFKGKAARDTDSEKMLDMIMSTVYMDFNALYDFGGSTTVASNYIINDKPFVSSYDAIQNKIATDIEKVVTGLKGVIK